MQEAQKEDKVYLKALTRQTGIYGVANEGDTVAVSGNLAEQLLANGGNWEKTTKPAPMATPEQEVERNESGLSPDGPVHKDATEAEIRNDEARALAQPTPSEIADAKTETQEEVLEQVQAKEDKAADKPTTKEDKTATKTK